MAKEKLYCYLRRHLDVEQGLLALVQKPCIVFQYTIYTRLENLSVTAMCQTISLCQITVA